MSEARPFVPYKERYFDDYVVGEVAEFGDHLVSEEEIIAFARLYDPQPFHADPVAARDSSFGGLVASGWMTGALLCRMLCDHFIPPGSAMGSPGIDQLRWIRPLRPGDRLRARITVIETRRSQSKPNRGSVLLRHEGINDRDEVVISYDGWGMFRCRP